MNPTSATSMTGKENKKIYTVALPRNSKVGPLNTDVESVERDENVPASFRQIFRAAMLLGLDFPRSLWTTEKKVSGRFLRIWNLVVVYFRTLAIMFYFFCNGYFCPSLAMQISFSTQIVLGYVLIWIFVVDRSKIKRSLKKLFSLSRGSEKASFVTVELSLVAIVLAVFSWTASKFFYFGLWDTMSDRLRPLTGFTEDPEFRHYFTWVAIFCLIFSYYSGAATLYLLVLLCAHSYRSCGELVSRYGRDLKTEAEERSLTADDISRKQLEFKEVSSCVRGVDEAFRGCALILYTFVMNDMFSALSGAFSSDRKNHGSFEYHVFLALKAATALTVFFYLTYSGSSVADQKLALQKRMIRISAIFMKQWPSTSLAMAYESLYSTIKHTDVQVTILDLFIIRKKLILEAAGVYFTYGVYMYQFVTTSDH